MTYRSFLSVLLVPTLLAACSSDPTPDAGDTGTPTADTGTPTADTGTPTTDTGTPTTDTGTPTTDTGTPTTDTGTGGTDSGATDATATDAGPVDATASDVSTDVRVGDAATGAVVTVTFADAGYPVALASLPLLDGGTQVALSSVLTAALPGRALTTLSVLDLRAPGFSAASRSTCMSPMRFPLNAELTSEGLVAVATGDLTWPASLMYPGCMAVHGLNEVPVATR
jgi:hypothetical protein